MPPKKPEALTGYPSTVNVVSSTLTRGKLVMQGIAKQQKSDELVGVAHVLKGYEEMGAGPCSSVPEGKTDKDKVTVGAVEDKAGNVDGLKGSEWVVVDG